MRIALGSDHGGFRLKERLKPALAARGLEVVDLGCRSEESVDYPDYALAVAEAVAGRGCERGILVCGTGIGMSMAANKVPGIRAALVHCETTARLAAQHNAANVLCLGARLLAPELAVELIRIWLETPFDPRHQGRLDKMARIEERGS
jgi:ribose 5-phosphate isomerase B